MPEHQVGASIGGYMGDAFRVHGDSDALIYEHFTRDYKPRERPRSTPQRSSGQRSGKSLDRIGVGSGAPVRE